jgi:hypothetical protein
MKSASGLIRGPFRISVVSLLLLLAVRGKPLQAASAVATGVDSHGQITWGWAAGDNLEDAKRRAMGFCRGTAHPKIIVYTPTRGYGAIVVYKEAGNGINVAASVGDPSERQAINGALKKAKMAGGHTPKLWRTWHDFAVGEINF